MLLLMKLSRCEVIPKNAFSLSIQSKPEVIIRVAGKQKPNQNLSNDGNHFKMRFIPQTIVLFTTLFNVWKIK